MFPRSDDPVVRCNLVDTKMTFSCNVSTITATYIFPRMMNRHIHDIGKTMGSFLISGRGFGKERAVSAHCNERFWHYTRRKCWMIRVVGCTTRETPSGAQPWNDDNRMRQCMCDQRHAEMRSQLVLTGVILLLCWTLWILVNLAFF